MAFWLQRGPQTSSWLQVAAQSTDIPMACGGNMGHGHQRGLESHALHKDNIPVSSELDIMAAACDLSTQDLESGASVGSMTRLWLAPQ